MLFVIDQIPYKAAVQKAQASVATAEANEATAKQTLEGKQMLYNEKVVSDFELRTAQNEYKSAQASLMQAKAELTDALNNLSYTEVKSPVDGYAGMTSFRIGALVSSSMTEPLITVSDNSEMYAYFSLSEKHHQKQCSELQRTVQSAETLYRTGNATYLELLTARQSLLSAQLNVVQDTFTQCQAMISLYNALGGGSR